MIRPALALTCLAVSAGPAFANGPAFDLIYEPADGSVWFDTNGGRMIGYILQGGPYLWENHTSAIIPPDIPKRYDSASTQLGSVYSGAAYLNDPVNIGQVLPAGLTEQELPTYFTRSNYFENVGQGFFTDFEFHYGFPQQRQTPYGGTDPTAGPTSVRIAIQGLFDAQGKPLTVPAKTMAVIDVDGDGLAGFDLENWTGDSFLPDPDDVLISDPEQGVWYEQTGDGGVLAQYIPDDLQNSVFNSGQEDRYDIDVVGSSFNDDSTVGEGDSIYLFYFPELSIDAESPGMFQPFGVVQAGFLSGPGAFTEYRTIGVDTVYLADNSTGEGTIARYATVPEPASLAILGLGAMMMPRRRRLR